MSLPNGWCRTSLEKIASWGSGGTPSRNVERYFQGTIPWVKTGELEGKYIRETEEHISEEALKNSSAKIFPKGSVGVAMYGATIGKLSIWGIDASTNQACAVGIPTEAINNEFLYYYLLSERRNLIKAGKGGAQPNLSQGIIKEWPINLPPFPEQLRIVAKIEELFSELDKGIENLKTARAQLKVYRQALLKHAFEGKLTAQWRAERSVTPAKAGGQPLNDMDSRRSLPSNEFVGGGNDKPLETADALLKRIQQERAERYQQQLADWQASGGRKPKAPKSLPPLTDEELAELPELPEGWGWVLIDVLLSLEKKPMATGPFGTLLSKSDHKPSGIPVLGIENIGNGKFVGGNKIFVSMQKAEELESFSVESGDIVISRSGTVGEICKIPEGLGKAFISTNLIRVSLNTNVINQDYFVYLFQGGGSVKQQVKQLCKGSSREFLNQTILSAISFPLPSIEEQRQIVDAIDAKFSIVDQLELTIATSLQQSDALRQSILKKAFSGQLVPQDPHDLPASELLARIKAERAEVAVKPRKSSTGNKLLPVENDRKGKVIAAGGIE